MLPIIGALAPEWCLSIVRRPDQEA